MNVGKIKKKCRYCSIYSKISNRENENDVPYFFHHESRRIRCQTYVGSSKWYNLIFSELLLLNFGTAVQYYSFRLKILS